MISSTVFRNRPGARAGTLLLLTTLVLAMLVLAWPAIAEESPPDLFGPITQDQLAAAPYATWFTPAYEAYTPNPAVLDELRALDLQDVELTIFFGTWCGDSQREVPRLLALLETLEMPDDAVRLVAVGVEDDLYKRSPSGEERGLGIFRVPTVIVQRDGNDVARLVEHPAHSLERDLLAMLTSADYVASYRSFPVLRGWLAKGLLADPNISADGLADQVRGHTASDGEIASVARVLSTRGQHDEGVKLFEVNRALYPESASAHGRLATARKHTGDIAGAHAAAVEALALSDDPELTFAMMSLLHETFEHRNDDAP